MLDFSAVRPINNREAKYDTPSFSRKKVIIHPIMAIFVAVI